MNSTEKKERLLLISTDERLEHLLAAEANELCISLRTEPSPTAWEALSPTVRLILWDMDTVPLLPSFSSSECPVYGLTHLPPPPPPPPLSCVLHLPLSIDFLRTELLRVIYANQLPHVSPQDAQIFLRTEEEGITLHIGENQFTLTENEAAIMSVLLQHRGQTVTKEQLRQAIENAGVAPASEAADHNHRNSNKVEVHLCHLRAKLEIPLERRLFTTVRGVGYRLDIGDEYTH